MITFNLSYSLAESKKGGYRLFPNGHFNETIVPHRFKMYIFRIAIKKGGDERVDEYFFFESIKRLKGELLMYGYWGKNSLRRQSIATLRATILESARD